MAGAANTITAVRLVGSTVVAGLALSVVLTATLTDPQRVVVVTLGTGCLILDGVDGAVARRRGEVSAFGARFDMEVDAFLLAGLSLLVVAAGVAGPWVLAIAGLRYLYVSAGWIVPALRTSLPPRYSRKVIAVVQGVALLSALVLHRVVPSWPASVLLGGALVLLIWSFARDIVGQLRVGRARNPGSASYGSIRR